MHVKFGNDIKTFTLKDLSLLDSLNIKDQTIIFPGGITEISITHDLFIITTADPIFQDNKPHKFEECSTDLIKAYDWQGNLVWSIKDIIPNINAPLYGGFIVDQDHIMDILMGYDLQYNNYHDFYVCFIGGLRYIIDLQERKVIAKSPTK